MTTIVYQSFRTANVPDWINTCLQSVREWAHSKNFEYRFFDDEMFDRLPGWFIEKAADNLLVKTDLGRLLLARELLDEGGERVIWMDADLLVFDRDKLEVPVAKGYAVCRETWVGSTQGGVPVPLHQVNNAAMVYARSNTFLDFYIDACETLVRHVTPIDDLSIGTRFLTRLSRVLPLVMINRVGTFSPYTMRTLAESGGSGLATYCRTAGTTVYAANLCGSKRGQTHDGVTMDDALFSKVVDNLLSR